MKICKLIQPGAATATKEVSAAALINHVCFRQMPKARVIINSPNVTQLVTISTSLYRQQQTSCRAAESRSPAQPVRMCRIIVGDD